MSLNKVLNRPLFRQQALKQGALKPVKARIGQMIGPPTVSTTGQMARNFPLSINQQGFFGRNIRPAMQRSGRFLKSQFGLRPLLGASGTYQLSSDIMNKLGVTGPVATGINTLAGFAGVTPIGRAVGTGYLGLKGLGLLADKIRRDNFSPNLEYGTTAGQVTGLGGEPLANIDTSNLFGAIDPSKPKGRGAIKKAQEERKKLAQAEGSEGQIAAIQPDGLKAPENETQLGNTKVADLDKISKNERGNVLKPTVPVETAAATQTPREPNVNLVGDPAQFYGEDPFLSAPEVPVEQPKKPGDKKQTIDAKTAMKNRLSEQLQLAREIQQEMMQGRTSNSRSIFLSTLAAGLMAGTTKKRGIGGALEILGQALGPAVNNSVMVKMKEDEMEDRMLERSLDFSLNFLKAQNDASGLPDTKDIGVIQFRNPNGVVINTAGRVLKDGTKQIATGRIVNGVSEYRTVPANAKFIKNDDANKETLDISKDLGGKYGALKLINRSLGIIEKGDADAGVTGLFGLYSGRVGDALGDIFDYKKSQDKTAGQISFKAEQLKAAKRLVNSGEFDNITDARNYLNKQFGSFNSIYNKNLKSIKGRVKDGSKLDYERLAINETVLVYRLANSLKSKDRLTQKDIQMAKELVKVFPAFRGEASVISSLIAVSETIMDDIREKEKTYLEAGGATEYLINERIDAGLIPSTSTEQNISPFMFKQLEDRKKAIQGLSEDELEKRLGTNLFG